MYRIHDTPFRLEREGMTISVEERDKVHVYRRDCPGGKAEKILLTTGGQVLLNPVEPLNIPKALSPYLLIQFEKPLLMPPKGIERKRWNSPTRWSSSFHPRAGRTRPGQHGSGSTPLPTRESP